ncbi:autoinducer binding domain-containing protein [uncultured Mameliella sp.]|uniref:autoinducer binding domain-containing protein n=1 Tax=uncultured Mameliella sp. TaxID=1447087 RepID=UPI002617F934|nr:autoinducer binding domain-containing protein [uncultured Mameliella sp.]
MTHFDGTALQGTEKFIPPRLLDFLVQLEATTTTEHVWDLIVGLARDLGLTVVDYVYATDFRNWEQAQFIRTTIDSRWFDDLRRFPHIRYTSAFRMHGCRYLTPIMVGEEYLDEMGEISGDRRRHVRIGAEMGMRAGISIPLRMGDPGQAALITLGGDLGRADLAALAARAGLVSAPLLRAHGDDLTVFLCTGDGKTGTEVRRPGTSPPTAAE